MAAVRDIDVEQIVKQVRENIRQRRSVEASLTSAQRVSPFETGQPAIDFASLHSDGDIRHIPLASHRPVVGSFVILVKRLLRKLLTPILERQVAYNRVHARVTTHIKECIEQLDSRQSQALRAATGTMDALEQSQAQLCDTVFSTDAQLREMRATQSAMLAAESRLGAEVAAQSQAIQAERQAIQAERQASQADHQAQRERLARAERKLRRILHALNADRPQEGRVGSTGAGDTSAVQLPELEPEFDYQAFEDRFRGSEEEIKERQRVYVPYFDGRDNVLDFGCGRGEFLELLHDNGIKARGVDLDLDMVLLCRDKGLDVVQGEAFEYLGSLPDESVGGVFAAQVIEHVHPRRVIELVTLCYRKLAPGAALILETPNPTCLMVFADSFYRDLSHTHPVHPETMDYVFRAMGFHEVEVRFSAPIPAWRRIPHIEVPGADLELFNQGIERLNWLIFGFQDFAVIGRKGRARAHRDLSAPAPDS